MLLSVMVGHAQWSKKIKGNQELVTEIRETSDYDAIHVVSFFDVKLVNGKEGQIILEGESNLLPHIKTEVRSGKLTIDVKNNISLRTSYNHSISITVPVEDIRKLSLVGSGDVTSDFIIKTNDINLDLVGSGDIQLSLDTENVNADIVGSGDIVISGSCNLLKGKIIGSGDLNAKNLKSKAVKISILGSGDADVFSSEQLEVKVLGSGDVLYSGDPKEVEIVNNSKKKIVKKTN